MGECAGYESVEQPFAPVENDIVAARAQRLALGGDVSQFDRHELAVRLRAVGERARHQVLAEFQKEAETQIPSVGPRDFLHGRAGQR